MFKLFFSIFISIKNLFQMKFHKIFLIKVIFITATLKIKFSMNYIIFQLLLKLNLKKKENVLNQIINFKFTLNIRF